MPVKYTDELRARAVELVIHAQADPATANGSITRVAKELGLSKETLRVWVRKHKDPAGSHRRSLWIWNRKTDACGRSWPKPGEQTRSCAEHRLSSRRSSTAHQGDRRLHRRES